jgi:hypothetical protein
MVPTMVTVLHWYGSRETEGKKVEGVFAECPRCGFRVFGRGTDAGATARCMKRLEALCPRAEGNTYSTEVLPVFQDVPPSPGRGPGHGDQRSSADPSLASGAARPVPVEPAA